MACWYVPVGNRPTVEEAMGKGYETAMRLPSTQ